MATETLHSATSARYSEEKEDRRGCLEELLTVDDVAALLKVNKSWVYEHTRTRRLPRTERLRYVKLGKYVRFEARVVREFLAGRSQIG
jgi:excisionase family DNA binding protein